MTRQQLDPQEFPELDAEVRRVADVVKAQVGPNVEFSIFLATRDPEAMCYLSTLERDNFIEMLCEFLARHSTAQEVIFYLGKHQRATL